MGEIGNKIIRIDQMLPINKIAWLEIKDSQIQQMNQEYLGFSGQVLKALVIIRVLHKMSAQPINSNENSIDEKLKTYQRRKFSSTNPNHPQRKEPTENKRKRKEKDIGWNHGEMLNGLKQHWRCNYCGLVRHGGGVTRLKLHLIGHTDVRKCPNVPDRVVDEISASLKLKEKRKKKDEESWEMSSSTDSEAELDSGGNDGGEEGKWESLKSVLEDMLSCGDEEKDECGVNGCIRNALSRTSTSGLMNQEGRAKETTSEKCKEALINTLISDKFASLCDILRNTFRGENSEDKNRNYFEFSEIDAKLKNGDYERSPQMFIRDMRKVWEKFEKVGKEMVKIANSLSIVSRNNIENEVGIQIKPESLNPNHTEPDQTEPYCTCTHCRTEITHNWGIINCKGCNTSYHKSCINPLLTNPSNNHFYCSLCITQNPNHDLTSTSGDNNSDPNKDLDSAQPCITAIYRLCKICGAKEEENKEFLVCTHPECPYKYYHTRCLTKCQIGNGTQVRENGYVWFCMSCLCRVCLCDKDDDLIVLCDGCDEAFHIYCMDPVRDTVPKGKWFCGKCGAKKKKEKGNMKNKKYDDDNYKVEMNRGMDLLLSAVEVLNAKENDGN